MSGNSINDRKPKIFISVSGRDEKCNGNDCFASDSEILTYNYTDNLKKINIFFGESRYIVNKDALGEKIHNVRKIFSEYIDDNVDKMSVTVLAKDNLKQNRNNFENPNSIHVNFDSGNQVLIYSWPHYHQFDENKWNNFLLQLEENRNLGFIGTGGLQFKYKGFNYRVYPPFVNLDHGKAFNYYKPEVFSFSPTEISQIIEDIKESHQSIEKKIIDYYQSLEKDFVKNGKGYIHIRADIDGNNVKNFTDVSYTNKSDGIDNNPIEEAFVKEEELHKAGGVLHNAVYMNNEPLLKGLLGNPSYDVNEVNKNDRTPLHLAAKYGRVGMVEMLLDKGAKVDVVDNRGRTPLHLAAANDHKEVVEVLLKAEGINVNAVDEDGETPFDLTTNEEIKALLKKAAEKTDPVDESSTDSEGDQEEDAGTEKKEKQEGDAKSESDIAEKGTGVSNGSQPTGPTQNNGGQPATSAEKGTDVATGSAQPIAPIEPAQTEEQPSSFFGSLFSILMKPFSLIGSFFGGFFSWLFGSNEEKIDESTSQTDARCEGESSSCNYDATRIDE